MRLSWKRRYKTWQLKITKRSNTTFSLTIIFSVVAISYLISFLFDVNYIDIFETILRLVY